MMKVGSDGGEMIEREVVEGEVIGKEEGGR